ncbi:hypothetical protein PI125_g25911 [Phytophthora idaei]|nr:hypothetical protein PI125_g25911 [Phytophthora idaei]
MTYPVNAHWNRSKAVLPLRLFGSGVTKSIDTIWNGRSAKMLPGEYPRSRGRLLLVLQSEHDLACFSTSEYKPLQ